MDLYTDGRRDAQHVSRGRGNIPSAWPPLPQKKARRPTTYRRALRVLLLFPVDCRWLQRGRLLDGQLRLGVGQGVQQGAQLQR